MNTSLKIRNPFGVWILGVITLGIYELVWMAKLCREVAETNPGGSNNVSGTNAVLSTIFGGFTLQIWPLINLLRFGSSVNDEQASVGLTPGYSNGLAVLFYFLAGTHVCYIQSQQNKVVNAKTRRSSTAEIHGE